MLIGDEIKRIRLEKGMTQQELADLCNLSRPYITHIEANRRIPRMDLASAIFNSMGVEMKIEFNEITPVYSNRTDR